MVKAAKRESNEIFGADSPETVSLAPVRMRPDDECGITLLGFDTIQNPCAVGTDALAADLFPGVVHVVRDGFLVGGESVQGEETCEGESGETKVHNGSLHEYVAHLVQRGPAAQAGPGVAAR